ncbi:hypothetical protein ACROYT_G044043 [Oculina patagonica]
MVGLAVGDIEKIQVNALIDRYVMQVELVLEMEETVPKSVAQRAHVKKHVEYPNKGEFKLRWLWLNSFQFSIGVIKPKLKFSLQPITKDTDNPVNQ